MNFGPLIQQVLGMGLPILGTALGGPLGGIVANMIATAIGAPTSSTPGTNVTDILSKLQTMNTDEAVQKLRSAEAEYVATIQAQAQLSGVLAHEVGETQRAEIAAAVQAAQMGGWGRFVLGMQISWRPVLAYQTIAEFTAMSVVAIHEFWTGDIATVNAIINFSGFLTWYFGMKLGLLGVYSVGRSVEKVNGVDDIPAAQPSWLDNVIKAIKGKK